MQIKKLDTVNIKDKKILAFGAHPDDIEFGAGGTIAQLSSKNDITIIIVTDGGLGTHDSSITRGDLTRARQNEAKFASNVLGVKRVIYWSYPDGALRAWDKNLRQKLVKILLRERPHLIFSFDPWVRYEAGLHPDHRTLAWAIAETWLLIDTPGFLRKMKRPNVPPLKPKPELWLYAPAEPNYAVDITEVWDMKLKALNHHQSQYDGGPFRKVEDRLKTKLSEIGSKVGVPLAEPFRILK